jgi:protein-S-isoprenylcysteine O-methyltransferase Ste14
MSDESAPGPRRQMTPVDAVLMVVEGLLFLGQIALAILYYNHAGLTAVLILGWLLLVIAMLLGWRARVEFQVKGQAAEGRSWLNTTAVVDTGIYAIVRHPMYLSFMLIALALICLAQHWLSLVLGILLILLLYSDMVREEQSSLAKLGEDYGAYMRKVPRMNFVAGLIRARQRSRIDAGTN